MIRRAVAVLIVAAAPVLGAQEQVFSGSVPQGAWLRIRNYKGDIRVSEGSGSTVTINARRRDDETQFEVKRDGQNVTICAMTRYTTRCDERGYSSHSSRNDDERRISRTDLVVTLPRGVKLVAATGNGDVDVRNAGAEVEASSGNGEINVTGANGRVSASSGNGEIRVDGAEGDVDASSGNGDIYVTTTKGPVSANTGNGSIDVTMRALAGSGNEDMDFNTGNGTITVAFPANLSARIEANGAFRDFETDFPIDMGRGWSANRVRGTIGSGSRRITFNTGNGRIKLRKI
ncbi:MAG TPA: DUF4097 family beta strand repeat-containing protein [Gemmatimonadaceae bacterium]